MDVKSEICEIIKKKKKKYVRQLDLTFLKIECQRKR